MPPVRVVTDSTADLPSDYREANGILTVPLRVIFGEEVLRDGVDIDADGFYRRLRAGAATPRTSQPTPNEFEAAFREAARDGASVVCTTISAEMSGTYGAALAARESVPDLDVHVVDTRTVAVGHHAIARAAVRLAGAGATATEVVDAIAVIVRTQRSVFTVSTLEYLRRGGRIGGARALLGSVLSIKPVLQVLDGRIEQFDRVRTYQRALERIAETVAAAAGESGRRATVVVGHCDAEADARTVLDRVAPYAEGTPELMAIGPIVGAHAGPGTVGLSFHIPAAGDAGTTR